MAEKRLTTRLNGDLELYDSVALTQIISSRPPTDILLENGLGRKYDARSPGNYKFVYNPPDDSPEPNITLFQG